MAITIFKKWIGASTVWMIAIGAAAHDTPGAVARTVEAAESRRAVSVDTDRPDPECRTYFGLDFPGRTPEPFAPDLFARGETRLHGAAVFSPAGDRLCWSVLPPAVMCVDCENGSWTDPRVLPLPGNVVQAPAFSADGGRLYFQAVGAGNPGNVDIWWVDTRRRDWTNAVNLGSPVNGQGLESQPSLTEEGDLYFTGSMADVGFNRGIFSAAYRNGRYEPPLPLPSSVNTRGIDYCPFIASDGRSLLFASNRGHSGEELYIHVTLRTAEGGWSEPIDLHPIMNHPQPARFPSISPDGRFLFFLSQGRIWWVDAAVLAGAGAP